MLLSGQKEGDIFGILFAVIFFFFYPPDRSDKKKYILECNVV